MGNIESKVMEKNSSDKIIASGERELCIGVNCQWYQKCWKYLKDKKRPINDFIPVIYFDYFIIPD